MHQGGLQWCAIFIAGFGLFCIISAPTVAPAWLWKSQAASVIATCYARASTKAKKKKIKKRPDFGRSYRHRYSLASYPGQDCCGLKPVQRYYRRIWQPTHNWGKNFGSEWIHSIHYLFGQGGYFSAWVYSKPR